MLRSWFEHQVVPEFKDRILSVNYSVARHCAKLHVPNPKSERDAWIAAIAMANNLSVVTRNTKDFADIDVNLINPWL